MPHGGTTVNYHRIYIKPVVVSGGGFAAEDGDLW
jgi:hypothetical protein